MGDTLYILRGVSGCGKTTLAATLLQSLGGQAIAADDYFYDSQGNYNFDVGLLGKAHSWCRRFVEDCMRGDLTNIILHNTSTSEKELEPYLDLAEDYGYKVISLVVENRHGNNSVHNVPEQTLLKQERKLRNSIKLK